MAAMLIVTAMLSFLVAYGLLRVLLTHFARLALDRPNDRSLHERPVPRTGGIAVLLGGFVALPFSVEQIWLPVVLAFALGIVSFFDDLYGLPSAARLAAHLAAAALFAWYAMSPMAILELALVIVGIAWLTNLYNFMDGSDGLAGGMALIGFTSCGIAAYIADHTGLVSLCTGVAAASAAFLIHNFHPARIFLGDVGSIPLGFLAGAVGILGWQKEVWPLWFPILVFGPFIGDATLTLVKRLIRGERVWRAHREHYYQRMVRMGLGHRTTAWIAYATMTICAAAALFGRQESPLVQAGAFAAASLILAAIAAWVDVRWARFLRQPPQPA